MNILSMTLPNKKGKIIKNNLNMYQNTTTTTITTTEN